MNQGTANETNSRAANQDHGKLMPMARPMVMAVRSAEATPPHPPAPIPGPSALSLTAVSHLEKVLNVEPAPVWLAALLAVRCQARSQGIHHEVRWRAVSGRAVYTNFASGTERIEPLGVSLQAGDTLAVWWDPGETAYTMEVYSNSEKCA